jgi:hypothetical protein
VDSNNFLADQPRWFEVAIGVVTAAIAAALLSLDGCFGWSALGRTPPTSVVVMIATIGLMGLFFLNISRRLLLGKRRGDGGLFPPLALRVAGGVFLCSPLLLFFGPTRQFINVLLCLGAGLACFTLANRRSDT